MRFVIPALAGLVLAAVATGAHAQDAAPKDAEAADERPHRAPIVGVAVSVKLRSGRVIKGVRQGPLYVRLTPNGYTECKPEERGAGVRVHFPRSQNGSILISMSLVEEVEELGGLSAAAGKQIALAIDEAEERAEAERKVEREAKELARIEAEKARLLEEANEPTEDDRAAVARAAELAEFAALLTRFPPGTWTLETPDAIARRRVVLGLAPSDEDMAFLKVFDTWKKAFGVWKEQQAAAAKAAAEAKESAEEPASQEPAKEPAGASGSTPAQDSARATGK